MASVKKGLVAKFLRAVMDFNSSNQRAGNRPETAILVAIKKAVQDDLSYCSPHMSSEAATHQPFSEDAAAC